VTAPLVGAAGLIASLAARIGKPLQSALEGVTDTPAGQQLKQLAESKIANQGVAAWQACLPWKRARERHSSSWLESYMEWLKGEESCARYHALLEEEFASLRG
jgi:hypothetical protein